LTNQYKCARIREFAKSMWVTIRKTPAKGFYKAKYLDDSTYGLGAIEIDGKEHEMFSAAEHFLDANGIERGSEFYFSIEYSLDK